jgi:ATP-dependent DNA helicase DinG
MDLTPNSNQPNPLNFEDFAANFPFGHMRDNQRRVFQEITDAFNSEYKYVILEAPTGSGKSAIAVTTGLTLGTSYILTSTKDLQAQYQRDFPFIRTARGMSNFACLAIDDLKKNNMYNCNICNGGSRYYSNDRCRHNTVEYGLCHTHDYGFENLAESCRYVPSVNDYRVFNRGTKEEEIIIPEEVKFEYNKEFLGWFHNKRLPVLYNNSWRPCGYYGQLIQAYLSSNSVFSYAMFLTHLSSKNMKPRQLLVLDEGHLFEKEIVEYASLPISNKRWKRYIPDLNINNLHLDCDDIRGWLPFLIEIETKLLLALCFTLEIERFAKERYDSYGYIAKDRNQESRDINTKISSFLEDGSGSEKQVITSAITDNHDVTPNITVDEKHSNGDYHQITSPALRIDAENDLRKINGIIHGILSSPKNGIVTESITDTGRIITFKPLNVASSCASIFNKCSKVLIMSATILDYHSFCKSLGLAPKNVKFIRVESDFPETRRPIYSMSVHPLNQFTLQEQDVRSKIARNIDEIMSAHKNYKGIIHTTSYSQVRFIIRNLSEQNADRLILTDPHIPREEIIQKHINSNEPTVLISPSLYMEIDLKDDLSRFQIITKVPYPDLGDKWINAKRKSFNNEREGEEWYNWQTALRLVQAYGRSIRSKLDWAITYILDSNFDWFVRRNTHLFPRWFLSAIQFKQVHRYPLRLF